MPNPSRPSGASGGQLTGRRLSARRQVGVLVRVFLGRFFENEATAGATDLRDSFFWLIAALAAPAILFAFHQQFYWNFIALGPNGPADLRVYVLFDKTLYLTFTAVAMGLVSVAVWNALVVDRRDAFIIGVLPVRRRVIVGAKLLSLTVYVGALNLGMHLGAAVLFGAALHGDRGLAAFGRGTAAHALAASATGMFVFAAIVALVSVCLTVVGPRRFARAGAALQLLLVAAIMATLLATPALCRGAVSLARSGDHAPWLLYMPPLWFLGVYETLAGTSSGVMRGLARTGAVALGGVALTAIVFYPVACSRVLRTAVSAVSGAARPWTRRVSAAIVERVAVGSGSRAALQFLLATAGRVPRLRLVLSAAIGLGLTLLAPLALHWYARGVPRTPSVSLLAAPLVLTMAIVAGWRVVMAMPSELPARWVFRATPADAFAGRVAARRFIYAAGVLVPLGLFAPSWLVLWGAAAWPLLANALLAGGILVETHLWGFAGMPCTRAMAVSDSNVQGRWPFYAAGLASYALVLPLLEVWLSRRASAWVIAPVLLAAYGGVRAMSREAARVNVLTGDHRGPIMLDLPLLPRSPVAGTASARALREARLPTEIPHA